MSDIGQRGGDPSGNNPDANNAGANNAGAIKPPRQGNKIFTTSLQDLQDVFSLERSKETQPAPAAVPGVVPPVGPDAGPVEGSGDDVSASNAARVASLGLLVIGAIIALLWPEDSGKAFKPAEGFILLTGFYIAAQAIERLLELLPAGSGTRQAKADRAVIFGALGFILAVVVAELLHLYFVSAVGSTGVDLNLDVIITALAVGGGTKPLHDFIKRIEKAKQSPPATT